MVLILYRRLGTWHVPFVARRADLRSHPGQVGLPGGGVRPGETAWAGAAREAEEEIGVDARELVPLGAGGQLYAGVSNYSVAPFVAWLPGDETHFVPQPSELDAVLEAPLSLLLDPGAWQKSPNTWTGCYLPLGSATIWGLTARILSGLLPQIHRALTATTP